MIDSIIQCFDIWSDAQGLKSKGRVKSIDNISLEGVFRLRGLIIRLALRGKLVPQSINDEPASELFKRIEKEKARLIKETKIKSHENFPEVSENNRPFILPKGWEWKRVIDCFVISSGTSFDKSKELSSGEYLYLKVADMNIVGNEIEITKSSRFCNPTKKELNALIPSGSIIFPKRGGAIATNKKRIVKKDLFVDLNIMSISPFNDINLDYAYCWLNGIDLEKLNTGTSVPQINHKDIAPLFFPLPPIAEQQRIVAKVDELMKLCDKLEEEQANNLKTHQQLVKSLLETLIQSTDADELQVAWQRMSPHFDILFCTEDSIDQLKQTILQLAVMGKLVKQDPNDEPACELKKKIFHDFEKRTNKGNSKKNAVISEIKDEEKPFILPDGWAWAKLHEIIQISSGDGLTASNMNVNGTIPVFGGNGINGFHDKHNVTKPTLVIGRVGFYCGSIHITPATAWVTDNAFVTIFSENNISIDFLYWLLKATNLKEHDSATAQPVISGRKIYPIVVALPPYNEQKRIVTKLVELYSTCNLLKEKIGKTQKIKKMLSKTIVESVQ